MRVNVYAEELTDEVKVVETTADTGRKFYGLRFFLCSPEELHHSPGDDDRSAVTLWVPWTAEGGHDFGLVQRLVNNLNDSLGEAVIREEMRDKDDDD